MAALNYFAKRMPGGKEKRNKLIRIVIAGAAAFVCSLTGFTKLVATVYPVIGYIGIISLILIIEHSVHILLERRKDVK